MSSPFDGDVEKATSENNAIVQWDATFNICDNVRKSVENAKACLRSIMKRLNNPDPHIVIQAVSLLNTCINNCGKNFHLEIASSDFENNFRNLLKNSHDTVVAKLKVSLKKWTQNEFKSDPDLNGIPSLYRKLAEEGFDFRDNTTSPVNIVPLASKSSASSGSTIGMIDAWDSLIREAREAEDVTGFPSNLFYHLAKELKERKQINV